MPEQGVPLKPSSELLTLPELVKLASLFVEAGVDKIRLTGGEPLVRKDVVDIVEQFGQLPGLKTLAMTTNGIKLKENLPRLKAAGLNMLNISLDTFSSAKFTEITRRLGWERVMASIDLALELGYNPVKINCVVMRGLNEHELPDFVAFTKNKAVDVRFIEYMPFDDNRWSDRKIVPYKEMLNIIQQSYPSLARAVDAPNDTSKHWQVPGHVGRIGFISSMTDHFCGSCNRLRLTADGNMKNCLFGSDEVSLRNAVRRGDTDEQLRQLIGQAVQRKKASHGGLKDMHAIAGSKNRPMILIGG
jgi:cyclic pyranopterin phosphate synthase